MAISVYNNINNGLQVPSDRQEKESVNLNEGDIIQGTVGTVVSNQISINFDEKRVNVSAETLPNAKEGDVISFRVMKDQKGTTVLKALDQQVCTAEKTTNGVTIRLSDVFVPAGDAKNASGKNKSVKATQDMLGNTQDLMTIEDYDELSKEGNSLEKYNMDRFERALDRIKQSRAMVQESIDRQVVRQQEQEKDLEEFSLNSIPNDVLQKQIETMLSVANLPVTSSNVASVKNALVLAEQSQRLNNSSMSYMLSNQMDPTIMNIYRAIYSGAREDYVSSEGIEADWEELVGQVEDMIAKSDNAFTLEDAKWLFDHDLPIDEETAAKYNDLKNIKTDLTVSDALSYIVKAMSENKASTDASMSMKDKEELKQVLSELDSITDEAVDQVYKQGKKINLKNLAIAKREIDAAKDQYVGGNKQNRNQQQVLWEQRNADEILTPDENINLITARRQLEEIRVKLTYDAGVSLLRQGIEIHTEGIDELVNQLRNLEDTYYQTMLSEGGANITSQNVSTLKDTYACLYQVKISPSYVLGTTVSKQNEITLTQLSEEGYSLSAKFGQADQAYDTLMTRPRADMGDSIKKAFASVDPMLDELGLEHTTANERAVRILGYNEMEISKENIDKIKQYDQQVNYLIKELKPATTVELIKHKINPIQVPIMELIDQVDTINSEFNITSEEKYSNYLVKVQKNHELSPEEKDAYIGIYRLLNNVEKTDGKAVGMLVKANQDITLGHLLSAVRTIKGKGIDQTIDDSFGMLSSLTYASNSISSQIEGAFTEKSPNEAYQEAMAKELLRTLSPGCIDTSNAENVMNMTLESLYEANNQYQSMSTGASLEEYTEFLKDVKKARESVDGLRFVKDYGVQETIRNILSADDFVKDMSGQFEELKNRVGSQQTVNDLAKAITESETVSELKNHYTAAVHNIDSELSLAYESHNLTVDDMVHLNHLCAQNDLRKDLADKNYYQIPVEVNGKTVGVGVLLQSKEEGKGTVSIELDSSEFGKVSADFKLSEGSVSGYIICENQSGEPAMKYVMDSVTRQLAQSHIEVGKVYISSNQNWHEQYKYQRESEGIQTTVDTKGLLETAKAFVIGVKQIDQ